MSVNYLALGKVAASNGLFAGHDAEAGKPITGASLLRDTILKKIKTTEVRPHRRTHRHDPALQFRRSLGGLPSDKGCVWNGNLAYSYQTESWFIDISAKCNGKDYPLKGNMPFTVRPMWATSTSTI